MELTKALNWATEIFGDCELGDKRRVQQLIEVAARQATMPESSTLKTCDGDSAAEERCYRFLRSKKFKTKKIDDGAFAAVAKKCSATADSKNFRNPKWRSPAENLNKHYQPANLQSFWVSEIFAIRCIKVVLAIQNTTTLAVSNLSLREELVETGCPTGWVVHSTLALDGDTGCLLGLLDQERWVRPKIRPGKATRAERKYEEKESFKWQRALAVMNNRLSQPNKVITVCDREADIYDFIFSQHENHLAYLIRARINRKTSSGKLYEEMAELPLLGLRTIKISQQGSSPQHGNKRRPARSTRAATLEVRAGKMTILTPRGTQVPSSVETYAVLVEEINAPEGVEPVLWRLLTSEPVHTFEEAEKIIRYYENRWLIEEFHKSWKTGCQVEERHLQTLATLERHYSISAHIAVRLLQLKSLSESDAQAQCTACLEDDEWQCLYISTHKDQKLPKTPPDMRWAYYALAKLGGWIDTKHTGRVGWKALWDGYKRLEERVIGWRIAKSS